MIPAMERIEDLIYDWNNHASGPTTIGPIEFDDETLRDGLQAPSVADPSIEQKLELIHLMDRLGIQSANIGLPGAGGRPREDILRITREMADNRLSITPLL